MATILAVLYKLLIAPILGYVSQALLKVAAKLVPPVLFLAVFALEWSTGTIWARTQLLAVVATAIVLTLELSGNLNPAATPAAPVTPATPTKPTK